MDYKAPVWLLDVVLFIFLLEWIFLNLRFKRTQKGLNFLELNIVLAPGFCLMVAFRISAEESISIISMACIFFAGLLHVFDLYLRQQKGTAKE